MPMTPYYMMWILNFYGLPPVALPICAAAGVILARHVAAYARWRVLLHRHRFPR